MSLFRKAGQIVVRLNTGPRRILARNRLPDAEAVARHGLLGIGTNRCVGCKLSSLARSCTSPRACNSIGHLRVVCETFGSDVDIPHGLSILRPLDSESSTNRSRLTAPKPAFLETALYTRREKSVRDIRGKPRHLQTRLVALSSSTLGTIKPLHRGTLNAGMYVFEDIFRSDLEDAQLKKFGFTYCALNLE